MFSTDGANQSFDEEMGHRYAWKGLNLLDAQNSQICLPVVKSKYGVMIGAEPVGHPCSADDLMEQAA